MNFVSGIHGDHGPLAMLPRLCQCAANTLSTNCRVDSRRLKVSARARASSSGGLDFAKAAEATSNQLSARNLAEWNMHKVSASVISVDHAAEIASRVLIQRIAAIHRYLPHGHALGVGLFVRRPPPFQVGTALSLDWSARFTDKETTPEICATFSFLRLDASPRRSASMRQDARSKPLGCPRCPPPRRSVAPFCRQPAYVPRGARLRRAATTSSGRWRSRKKIQDLRRKS